MTKSELIDAVARRTRITKSRAEQLVNCIFETMSGSLERGEGIEIRGFGSFSLKDYPSYHGHNPKTGESVFVPEKRLARFKAGKELRELVNQGTGTIEESDDQESDDWDDSED
jgi:integration host factor subunit beta